MESKVGDWDFSAHDFSEDELVYAGCAMLGHAMTVPEVEHWRLTEGMLILSLIAHSSSESVVANTSSSTRRITYVHVGE